MTNRSDLTGFAALLGDSFKSRIDLLAQVLQDAHYPSLGTYKERLLSEIIRDYLPRSVEVGTGFVLFPHEDLSPPGGSANHDPLNRSAFTISRQCDILIFDANSYPPVFRDGDFVVLRPESVKAVIEVKGSISIRETQNLLDSFLDFGCKWRNTQLFYKAHYQPLTRAPALFAMAWSVARGPKGSPKTNPARIREKISSTYSKMVAPDDLDGFPLLSKMLIYDEAEISSVYGNDGTTTLPLNFGWMTTDGRFRRFDTSGQIYRDKDRTIAVLLASLHIATAQENFNRFFSYPDETRNDSLLPYPHYGFSWAWCDVKGTIQRPFNADQVYEV